MFNSKMFCEFPDCLDFMLPIIFISACESDDDGEADMESLEPIKDNCVHLLKQHSGNIYFNRVSDRWSSHNNPLFMFYSSQKVCFALISTQKECISLQVPRIIRPSFGTPALRLPSSPVKVGDQLAFDFPFLNRFLRDITLLHSSIPHTLFFFTSMLLWVVSVRPSGSEWCIPARYVCLCRHF